VNISLAEKLQTEVRTPHGTIWKIYKKKQKNADIKGSWLPRKIQHVDLQVYEV